MDRSQIMGGATTLDPLFGPITERPEPAGLDLITASPVSCWLLDPGADLAPDVRMAMGRDIDISLPGLFTSFGNFVLIALAGLCLMPGSIIGEANAVDLAIGVLRIAAAVLVASGPAAWRGAATNAYVATTIAWCLGIGVISALSLTSGLMPLQVIAAASLPALQGLLNARNYAAPRFATVIMVALNIPFFIGCVSAHERWLCLIGLLTPSYMLAYAMTIRRFHRVAVESLQAQRRSAFQARHDPLTGALNRFGLMTSLNGESCGETAPIALFYLDLDGFKAVNDQHGHMAGDTLLRMVAERLRRASRGTDQVARLGGDEFVITVPGITPATAELFAARIIDAVTRTPYTLSPTVSAVIGISVGFACAPADCHALAELFTRADRALYIAKSKGKGVWHRL